MRLPGCTNLVMSAVLLLAAPAEAQVFGTVRVVVRDPQNLAIAGASVVVKRRGTAWSQAARSSWQGEAQFAAPCGPDAVPVSAAGCGPAGRAADVVREQGAAGRG